MVLTFTKGYTREYKYITLEVGVTEGQNTSEPSTFSHVTMFLGLHLEVLQTFCRVYIHSCITVIYPTWQGYIQPILYLGHSVLRQYEANRAKKQAQARIGKRVSCYMQQKSTFQMLLQLHVASLKKHELITMRYSKCPNSYQPTWIQYGEMQADQLVLTKAIVATVISSDFKYSRTLLTRVLPYSFDIMPPLLPIRFSYKYGRLIIE